MRAIDGINVIVPADEEQTRQVVRWAASFDGPAYIRIGRIKVPSVSVFSNNTFVFGQANRLREGSDLTLVATGTMVSRALEASDKLALQGIKSRVINISSIEPLDQLEIILAARETGGIVTVEEAVTKGGLGSAVAMVVVKNAPVPMRMLGTDHFAPTGSVEWLFEHYGLTTDGIISAALEVVGTK